MAAGRHREAQACFHQGLDLAWASQEIPRALETLILLATSHLEQGRREPASQWLSLASRHRATPERFRKEALGLSQPKAVKGADHDPELELQEVVEAILNGPL